MVCLYGMSATKNFCKIGKSCDGYRTAFLPNRPYSLLTSMFILISVGHPFHFFLPVGTIKMQGNKIAFLPVPPVSIPSLATFQQSHIQTVYIKFSRLHSHNCTHSFRHRPPLSHLSRTHHTHTHTHTLSLSLYLKNKTLKN